MHQDYIMRMIEQLTGFLMRVVMLRKQGKPQQAVEEIGEAYGKLAGVDGSLVHALSEEDLIALLRARGTLDPQRALTLAELLREEAHAFDDLGQPAAAMPRYLKALRLYLEMLPDLEEIPRGYDPAALDDLMERLDPADLPPITFELLLHHFESVGQYDDAENVLLAHIDAYDENPDAVAFGQDFYRRLLLQPDTVLEAGGLPRDEVEDGLAQLDAMASAPSA
jgi:hypothetical protein